MSNKRACPKMSSKEAEEEEDLEKMEFIKVLILAL
jgi:hypothetical protein